MPVHSRRPGRACAASPPPPAVACSPGPRTPGTPARLSRPVPGPLDRQQAYLAQFPGPGNARALISPGPRAPTPRAPAPAARALISPGPRPRTPARFSRPVPGPRACPQASLLVPGPQAFPCAYPHALGIFCPVSNVVHSLYPSLILSISLPLPAPLFFRSLVRPLTTRAKRSISLSPLFSSPLLQARSCVIRPLATGGPVGAAGPCGPVAAGAAGPARLAVSGEPEPGSGEYKHVVMMPILSFRARLQSE
jgi:hypothetical protein